MNKQEFLDELAKELSDLPESEKIKSLQFYDEMIKDMMEDGKTEQESVEALGNIDDIVRNIKLDMPIQTLIKAKVNENKAKMNNNGLWIVLAVVGFPIWFPLLIALFAIIFSLYVAVWSIIIALFSVVFAFGVAGVVGIVGGIVACFVQSTAYGLALIGTALVCIGLLLFTVKPIIQLAKWLVSLTGKAFKWLKSLFIGKKGA